MMKIPISILKEFNIIYIRKLIHSNSNYVTWKSNMYILGCMEDLIVWSIKVIVWMMDVTCLIEGHHPLLVGVTVGPLLPVPAENFEGIVCPPIHLLTDDWQLLLTIQKGVSTKLLRLLTKHLSQNENKSFIRSWDTQERRRGGVGYCNKHYL